MTRTCRGIALVWALAAAGCAAPDDPSAGSVKRLERDLSVGSHGDDVRAVHRYLKRFGYFPNEELQRAYPAWRPIIGDAPAFDDVFDERTEAALKQLQAMMELPQTGVADEATRELLATPRCGVPDGIPEQDPTEKWGHLGHRIGSRATWKIIPDLPVNAFLNPIFQTAFNTWSAETNLFFPPAGEAEPNIDIAFIEVDGPSGENEFGPFGIISAEGRPPGTAGADIYFDVEERWSLGATVPANALDLQTIAVHEIGHTIGLTHSSVKYFGTLEPVMWPSTKPGTMNRKLRPDDAVGISALYDSWQKVGCCARDVGVAGLSADLSGRGVWWVSDKAMTGGFEVRAWTGAGNNWTVPSPSRGAVRISVSAAGRAWIVQSNGAILRRTAFTPDQGSWEWAPGPCAQDIAAGLWNDDVWIVDCNNKVWRWNETNRSFSDQGLSNAARIAVDINSIPWVVNWDGSIRRKVNGVWSTLPPGGCARDIGAWDATWIISCGETSGGYKIYVWNEQAAELGTPKREEWVRVGGGAGQIAVGELGPWLVNNGGNLYMQVKPGTRLH